MLDIDYDDSEIGKLSAIKANIEKSKQYFSKIHLRAKQDLKVANGVLGSQWLPEDAKAYGENRNQMSFPVVDKYIETVVGNYNSHPYGIVYSALNVEEADKAKMINGVVKGIEHRSDAKHAYRTALRNAVTTGYGYIYLTTDYSDESDESLDVDIRIEPVINPLSILIDPTSQKVDGSDMEYAAHIDYISLKQAKRDYGDDIAQYVESSAQFLDQAILRDLGDIVPVITYYEKEYTNKTIWFAEDGTKSEKEIKDARSKQIRKPKVKVTKVVGNHIVNETTLNIPHIPIVPVYGLPVYQSDTMQYIGIVHRAIDAQRSLNYAMSLSAERLALSPKANYIADAKSIMPYMEAWKNSSRSNPPVLTYDAWSKDGTQQNPAPMKIDTSINVGDVAGLHQMYSQAISQIIGIPEGGIGNIDGRMQTAEETLTRAKASETILSTIYENLSSSVIQCGRLVLELLSTTYDTERNVPIVDNGQESIQTINFPEMNIIPNEYKVSIDAGPLLSTQRKENLRAYLSLAQISPPQYQNVLYPKIVESIDDVDMGLMQQVQQIAQFSQQQAMQGAQNAQATAQENEQLKQALAQAQQQIVALQMAQKNQEIASRTDLIKTQMNNENKIVLEQMKQGGDQTLEAQKSQAQLIREIVKAKAELDKEFASQEQLIPEIIIPEEMPNSEII